MESTSCSEEPAAGSQVAGGRQGRHADRCGFGQRLLLAVTVVVLLLGPQIATMMNESLTPSVLAGYMWERSDSLVMVALIVAGALAGVGTGYAIRRLCRQMAYRLYKHVFVLLLGAGLITNFWFNLQRDVGYHPAQHGMETRTLWIILIAMVGFSLGRGTERVVTIARKSALVLSPLAFIIIGQILTFETYPSPIDPFPEQSPEPAALTGTTQRADFSRNDSIPVYFILFDAWSYRVCYENQRLTPDLIQLRELSDRSIVFHEAHALGCYTETSIPRMLFQTTLEPGSHDGGLYFDRGGEQVPAETFKSIFQLVDADLYTTFVVASSKPYRLWLKDHVDVCRARPWYPREPHTTPLTVPVGCFVRGMQFQADEWSPLVYRKWRKQRDRRAVAAMHDDMLKDCREIITHQPRQSFLFAHYLLPHEPIPWDNEGNWRPNESWFEGGVREYMANMKLVDRHVGELAAAMQVVDRFDDALVILTADHAWHLEPDSLPGRRDKDLTLVPLIIKLPGQSERLDWPERFSHLRLGDLIRHVLAGEREPSRLLAKLDG